MFKRFGRFSVGALLAALFFGHISAARAELTVNKLVSKIDQSLTRIKNGTYGFCVETGQPIGIKRLMARPVAELCIVAQEKHEKEEKVYADL